MPASINNRIYYAVHQVGLKGDGTDYIWTSGNAVHGVQSVGISTNFNLEQVFELGQLAIYENIEEIPDVEVTLNKVLDGYPLMWHMATVDATVPTLAGRSNSKTMFALSVFNDTQETSVGTNESVVACSGMYVSSIGYTFSTDDNSNEDLTLVGNQKIWLNQPGHGDTLASLPDPSFDGAFGSNLDAPIGSGGVQRRQDVIFTAAIVSGNTGLDINNMAADANTTILPPEVFGISNSGTNEKSSGGNFDTHISRISISADLNREQINELGRKGPYFRNVSFPVEVSCEIEVTATSGDMVSATEGGIYTVDAGVCADQGNLKDRTIRVATCAGTRIYLGTRNKLASTNYTGGDAGGDNVSVTYAFTTFNDFTVIQSGDPNASGAAFWETRDNFLLDV